TPCKYPGKNIAFHVNEGPTDYLLSLLVEFEDGDEDIGSMHIRESKETFIPFESESKGSSALKKFQGLKSKFHRVDGDEAPVGSKLVHNRGAPESLATLSTLRTLSARDVIPRNWSPKATYTSRLNFYLIKREERGGIKKAI
ncbi:unnamed protein product, partial [Thlaspi arvense]